ncbi:phage major capsid protein [Desulfatitalea tepidiphila]|uniref:phage major capsid protein n=1 Tax=Desulfatitalea tepidiphila TaxID=1185843 RepID=UPI0006B43753|nr:phage major capsid protein [Desulfatitalea tepidiphila]
MEKRTFQIEVGSIRDADQRTVEATLSTTYPVRRYDGEEVLSHDPDAIDLTRAPLPLISAHNERSLPVGIVESLQVIGGKLRGLLRISKSQDRIWGDIQDGILRNLSIGYFIKEKKRTAKGYLVTKWQPYECSLVAAGADPAAGIGRSITTIIKKEKTTMDYNDILKAKKRAVDELTELAMTENLDDAATARFDELKGEIRTLDGRIEAIELAKAGKEDLAKRSGTFKPELEKKQDRTIRFEGGPAADRSYKGMFGEVRDADDAEMEKFKRVMIEGTGSAGGFSVPDPLAAQWLDESLQNEIIRPRATVWPMTSSTRTVPGWDGKDQSGGLLYGGFAMEFLAENAEGTAQDGKLRSITFKAHKGAIFCNISNELREDGQGFESQLEMAMKKSISLGLDYHFINGTGAGMPQGILQNPAKIEVAKESGQSADTVIFENAVNMFARMYPAGRSKAVWLANETTIPQLLTMSIAIGTGGSRVEVFKESNGQFTLLGRPLIFTPNLPVLGDAGDLVFVDLSQYAIGLRKDLRLEKSNIPGWTNDLMSYRVIVRVDGMGTWNTYISPRNGDSLSWCVTLAERAEG